MRIRGLAILIIMLLSLPAASFAANGKKPKLDFTSEPVYDYPIQNPFAATVIGTPPEMKIDYSDHPGIKERKITIFPLREVPEGFWYQRGLKYGEMLQKEAAPLVYIISGTGADHKSERTKAMADTLYSAGFSVVLLPSPTHPNFVINASENFMPGRPVQDAKDLYRVIKMIDPEIATRAKISDRMLTGYSLGGLNAAFVAKLDDEKKDINFSRVLLINPPYNLYSSIQIIDDMLYGALPNGVDDVDSFIKTVLIRLSSVSQSGDALDFSNERLLLDAYEKYQPSDNRLSTTIGLSFRLSASSMIFAADIMGHTGYIFPKNQEFTTTTHLDNYMSVALRTGLTDYFDEIYSEKYLAENPGWTKADLEKESSLQYLSAYIANNEKIGMITNRDDVVLAPGEIDKMAALFGNHALIYNIGGHTGNIAHPNLGYHIVKFMRGQGW